MPQQRNSLLGALTQGNGPQISLWRSMLMAARCRVAVHRLSPYVHSIRTERRQQVNGVPVPEFRSRPFITIRFAPFTGSSARSRWRSGAKRATKDRLSMIVIRQRSPSPHSSWHLSAFFSHRLAACSGSRSRGGQRSEPTAPRDLASANGKHRTGGDRGVLRKAGCRKPD